MATQARKGKSWLGSLMRLGLTYLLIRALFSARISLPAAPVKRDPVTGAADLHPPVWPGLWGFLKAVKAEIDRDRVFPVAAGVTFYAILALFPALAAFVTLYGIFADRAFHTLEPGTEECYGPFHDAETAERRTGRRRSQGGCGGGGFRERFFR